MRQNLQINLSKILKNCHSLNQINYRQCVSCRKVAPKQFFWRVVRLASSHEIQLDQGIGRSAYLCPNPDCLRQAKNKNRLKSALRTKVADHIYQNLQERLS
jgi:uncharacterized protein